MLLLADNEKARLTALYQCHILDTAPEQAFDDLARLTAQFCEAPIALIGFIDQDREWFKAHVGTPITDISRDVAFCNYAILQSDVFIVHDATVDERFANNPFVIAKPHLRFYAGVPLSTEGGFTIGALGIIDYAPRELSANHLEALRALGRQAEIQLRLRSRSYELTRVNYELIRVNDKLSEEVAERQRAENEVRQFNETLELQIAERTRQCVEANKELQSFCYSVSHDLNGPLRLASTLVDELYERVSPNLNETDLAYLQNTAKLSKHAWYIVNDLLTLFQAGHAEMQRQAVDMNELVRNARDDLKLEIGNRVIHWQIEALPSISGDPSMIRLVMQNLLSNAVKYTSPCAQAVITIGSMCEEGETVFFVSDNGVGFDMRYDNKIFEAFERFHSAVKFEGTGIGLAIVRKIVNRHGGRTWARGVIGKGATFYFSFQQASQVPSRN